MDLPTTRHDREPSSLENKMEYSKPVSNRESKSEKISFYVFLATLFLAPFSVIPSAYAPVDVVKAIVISVGILVTIIICTLGVVREKTLTIPKGALFYSSMAILVSLLISTLLSVNISRSFIGQGFEIGTTSFILLMFLVLFYVAKITEKQKERTFNIYAAIFVSFIILALFHVARIIGGSDFISLGVLSSLTSSLVGKWYDFGIMCGLVGLLSFFGIKFLSLGKGLKSLLYILLIICGAFLLIVNFNLIWWAIALSVLFVAIFEYQSREPNGTGIKKVASRISVLTLAVLIISVICGWNQSYIKSHVLKNTEFASYNELVLPWQLTLDVASDSIKENPLFGSGPNRFVNEFLKFKPYQSINSTVAWSAEFSNGFGNLPSFIVTQGIVGLIVWLIFFIFFIWSGISVLKKSTDQFKKFSITSTFFASLFLWIIEIIYIPSHVVFFITFVMTGLFFGVLYREGLVSSIEIGVDVKPRLKRFAQILSIIFLIIFVIWLGVYVKKTMAIAYFQSGIKDINKSQSVGIAQDKFKKALFWSNSDVYYQALSQVDLMKVNALAQEIQNNVSKSGKNPDQKDIQNVSDLVGEALGYTQKAISIDPFNYYNHVAQAKVLELASSLKIPNAYDNAKQSYTNAIALNPWNPGLYLNLARLEFSENKLAEAQRFVGNALQLKPNYIEAIFLLSQIQVSNGQVKDAIISSQVATQINPNDSTLFFQLGLLYYNDKNYTDAVTSFAKAIELNPQYANARYFLGLSYSRLGKNALAIEQFEELAKTNPDSQEIAFILSNLKSGKSPFADATLPIDNKPEKRKTLPVNEKNTVINSSKTKK